MQGILDTLKNDYPTVVAEVTKSLSVGEIQKVLQGLLGEQVSIRNMVAILETLADYAGVSREIGFLVEKARQALSRQICLQYADEGKVIRVLTIAPDLEQILIDSRIETTAGVVAALEPDDHRKWINALANGVKRVHDQGHLPVVLCSEPARALVKSSSRREIPDLVVLSVPEIAHDITVESLGEIRLE